MDEQTQEYSPPPSNPDLLKKEPLAIKAWAALGKAILPTALSFRWPGREQPTVSTALWAGNILAEAGAGLIAVATPRPEIAAGLYLASRFAALIAEQAQLKRSRKAASQNQV